MGTSRRYGSNDHTNRTQTVRVVLALGQVVQFTLAPGQPFLAPGQVVQVVLVPGQGAPVPGQAVQVTLAPGPVVLAPAQVVPTAGQAFPILGLVQAPPLDIFMTE